MKKFKYSGPVYSFEKCISSNEEFFTMAKSEKKAMCNFCFQAKEKFKKPVYFHIYLPGKVISLENESFVCEQIRMDI